MKKRLLALMLVAAMLMGMSMTTFAEGEGETIEKPLASKEATYTEFIKKSYTIVGNENTTATIFPDEVVKFTSKAASTNPDGGAANLTIEDLDVNGNTDQKITFKVPSFSKVGTYHFTISETAGNTQGVTYSKETLNISVLVTFDYEDTDNDNYLMSAEVGITNVAETGANADKNNTFTNTYTLGSLEVGKTVTGNLGDTSKKFNMTVTFTSDQIVLSSISGAHEITKDDWTKDTTTGEWTATAPISLAHGEKATFNDIPAGVTYEVVEADYTKGEKNGDDAYDAPEYAYGDTNQKINGEETDTVMVTNNKETTVDTGLIINNFPYILALVAVALVAFAFMRKRRSF